jgi:hypothetical protein
MNPVQGVVITPEANWYQYIFNPSRNGITGVTAITPDDEKGFTEEQLQEAVGGLVNIVPLDLHLCLAVNENKPELLRDRNEVASKLVGVQIVGTVCLIQTTALRRCHD